MLAAEDISRMTVQERIEAMDLLWESMTRQGHDLPSPTWHGSVIAERERAADSADAGWLGLDELQARLLQR
jgi:hypothetical protein